MFSSFPGKMAKPQAKA